MKHQFFLFPLAVSHGGRHKDFCTGAKKGSYHAQTSVASTMETVQSKFFVFLQELIRMFVHITPEYLYRNFVIVLHVMFCLVVSLRSSVAILAGSDL